MWPFIYLFFLKSCSTNIKSFLPLKKISFSQSYLDLKHQNLKANEQIFPVTDNKAVFLQGRPSSFVTLSDGDTNNFQVVWSRLLLHFIENLTFTLKSLHFFALVETYDFNSHSTAVGSFVFALLIIFIPSQKTSSVTVYL